MTLSEVIPGDRFVGMSLILRQGNRFLFGIRPARQLGGRAVLELTGIGGGLERGDRSISDGVLREAREEIGCDVRLLSCPQTLVVRQQSDFEQVVIGGDERPAAVVFRNYRTPPHRPWDDDHRGQACIIVFAADLLGQPRPAMELPSLIWLTPARILQTARDDVLLRDLLEAGAELIERDPGSAPRDGWTRLTDSQEALALALGDDTVAFYEMLAVLNGEPLLL